MSTISEDVKRSTQYNTITTAGTTILSEGQSGGLLDIGRPCKMPDMVDPGGRITSTITSKMATIDMIPCRYSINLSEISTTDLSGLIPKIEYSDAVDEFGMDCISYGLPNKFVGIRLHTTDDTQANDAIQNSRGGKNFFQGIADFANDTLSPIASFTASAGIQKVAAGEAAVGQISKFVGSAAGGITSMVGVGSIKGDIANAAQSLVQKIGDSAINGYRYSFPSIWSDSSYSPNITTNLKLISPYGHPDAIRKFIIEPLMYLIILASPKTKDGMAYGRPSSITLRAYGLSYVPLASISSIHLRRGGDGTNFNVYSQPTSIDVALEFEALVGGFATYTFDKLNNKFSGDSGTASNSNKFITEFAKTESLNSPTLTTLEHIVESLRPVPPSADIQSHVFIGINTDAEISQFPSGKNEFDVVSEKSLKESGTKIFKLNNAGEDVVINAKGDTVQINSNMNYSSILSSNASSDDIANSIVNNIKKDSNKIQAYLTNISNTQKNATKNAISNYNNMGNSAGSIGSSGNTLVQTSAYNNIPGGNIDIDSLLEKVSGDTGGSGGGTGGGGGGTGGSGGGSGGGTGGSGGGTGGGGTGGTGGSGGGTGGGGTGGSGGGTDGGGTGGGGTGGSSGNTGTGNPGISGINLNKIGRVDPLTGKLMDLEQGSVDDYNFSNETEQKIKRRISISADSIDYDGLGNGLNFGLIGGGSYNQSEMVVYGNKTDSESQNNPSGLMGPLVDLKSYDKDNLTYVGNLMNMPYNYDKKDPKKIYPTSTTSEINELHEPNFA